MDFFSCLQFAVPGTKINVGHRVCGTRLTVGLDMPLFFLLYLPGYPL